MICSLLGSQAAGALGGRRSPPTLGALLTRGRKRIGEWTVCFCREIPAPPLQTPSARPEQALETEARPTATGAQVCCVAGASLKPLVLCLCKSQTWD